MESHVLPYLLDEEEEGVISPEGEDATREYTHDEYVKGAEECLMIEDEMNQLDDEDLEDLEHEALADDPELVAQIITDMLKQDEKLLSEVTLALEKGAPHAHKDMQYMLEEGGAAEDHMSRAEAAGYAIAKLLSEEEDHHVLDEIDGLIGEAMGEDSSYEEHVFSEGDEL